MGLGTERDRRGSAPRRLRKRAAEILAAAAKVFARRGYHGASTQDIADVLGIRQASLYYYFESKEAALEAVCAAGVEDYAVRALRIERGPGSASEKVARLVFQHLAPMAERLEFTQAFLRERRFLPDPARRRIRAFERRYERIIQRVIEDGIASGEFRADLDSRMATLALLGLGNSAATWYGREPGATLERITSNYVDLLVRAFRKGDAPVLRVTH
ncbi:MAG TPA: TetR/AcrR family transcriptional regulator [Burkholderiales bacterium]|jgi:AcrR family transcriptional regulator|nr:TetR/AcrR family transcriptional regulator [Burkholderiales bacterium]